MFIGRAGVLGILLLLLRRRRREESEWVPPIPWTAILTTIGIVAAVGVAIGLLVWLARGS